MTPFERRLAAAQQMGMSRSPSGMVSYNPVGQRQQRLQQAKVDRDRARRPASTNAAAAAVVAAKGGGKQQDPGFLGKLMNNPVGKGVTGALSAVDVFRRAGVLGFEEIAEAVGGQNILNDDLDADRGILDRLGDSSYGFGDVVEDTGNKWLDRGIGFAGDVLLDPLTYVTFGAGRFAGQAGRSAAAIRLAEQGVDPSNVGRLGVLGATAAERQAIFNGTKGAEQGLRFAGQRIPGTGKVAEVAGKGLAETRAAIGDRLPTALRELRYENGLEPAFRTLRSGQGDGVGAAAQIAGRNARAGADGVFVSQFAADSDRLARQVKKAGNGDDVYHAIEMGVKTGAPEQDAAEEFFSRVLAEAKKSVDFQGRDNFVPHLWMDDARKALKGDEWDEFRKSAGIDVTEATGGVIARSIDADTVLTIPTTGEKITFTADIPGQGKAVSARQVNDKLSGPLGVNKVIETDLSKVLKPYVEGMGKSVGRAEGTKRVGVIAGAGEAGLEEVTDKAATKSLRREGKGAAVKAQSKAQAEFDRVANQLDQGGAAVQKEVLKKLQGIVDAAKDDVARFGDEANSARQVMDTQVPRAQKAAGRAADRSVSAAEKRLAGVGKEEAKLLDELTEGLSGIDAGRAAGKRTRDAERAQAKRTIASADNVEVPSGAIPETAAAREAQEAMVAKIDSQQKKLGYARESAKASIKNGERKLADAVPGTFRAAQKEIREGKQRLRGIERESKRLDDEMSKNLLRLDAERTAAKKARKDGQVAARADKAERAATPIPSGPNPATEAAGEAKKALGDSVASRQAALDARRDSIVGSRSEAEKKLAAQYDEIDAGRQAQMQRYTNAKESQAAAKVRRDEAKKALAAARKVKVSPSKKTVAAYAKVEKELDDALKAVGSYEGSDVTSSLMSWYAKGVGELRDGQAMDESLKLLEKSWKSGDIQPVLKTVVRDGYKRIGETLLGDAAPIVKRELAEQLQNFEAALNEPSFFTVIDKYTRFFKTYATSTVGFHVRNGMGAAFMNATDGVKVKNMARGADMWVNFARNGKGWLDELPKGVSEEQAETALRAVFGSGGSKGAFGEAEILLGKNIITNNAYTRLSEAAGGYVEGMARLGMALDTVLSGGSFDEAVARITRTQFDYSAISKLDKKAKAVFPFWTFMSRNVPLQMQQMMLKPKVYQHYRSFVRNMGEDYENDMVPLSWQEAGAFKVDDFGIDYLQPDFAHVRMRDDLESLSLGLSEGEFAPSKLLTAANPLFKVPFEVGVAEKNLFSGREFKENGLTEVEGDLSILGPLLDALGQTDTAGDGSKVIDEKLAYALRQLIPPLSQSQRLFGGDPYYEDKRAQSMMNWMGLPVKQLTERQTTGERKRRDREAKSDPTGDRLKALQEFVGSR